MEIAQLLADRASSDIVTCDADITMREAVSILSSRRIGALPVMEAGRVAGIFSERDVIHCLEREGASSLEKKVGEVMTAPAITVSPRTKVDEALALMTRRRIRHLPVLEGEAMCGFISIGDLVKSRLDEVEFEAKALRSYIQGA